MATAAEAVETLNKLWEELDKRQRDIDELDRAYRGEFKLHYASDEFQEYFGDRYRNFSDNWCGIVADAPHERLEITGVRLAGQTKADAELWDTWIENEADLYSDLALLDAIISKRSYALVWGDADSNPQITWEHPSQAIVGYDPETRKRAAGLKAWADDTKDYATLYLPDSVWKFERYRGTTHAGLWIPGGNGGWVERRGTADRSWPLPNPLGEVPLVEFRNRPRLKGEPISDISGTLAMQHAINLLWAQLFTAADYAGFPQRIVLGAEMPTVPILDEDGQEIGEKPIDLKKFAVNRAQWIEDPTASIAEWKAANLEAWTNIIEVAVGHVAGQSRTPAHYMLIGGTIANVPEGGLKALETGLAMRSKEKTQHFGHPARDVFRLSALVKGEAGKARDIARGTVLWRDVENRSDAQRSDALQKKRAMGYPLEYILELDGLEGSERARVMQMVREESNDPVLSQFMKQAGGAAPESTEAPTDGEPTDGA